MKEVYLNGIGLCGQYGLLLTKVSVTSPKPKSITVDVPGRDSPLDLSNYFGEIKYSKRELKFDFVFNKSRESCYHEFSRVTRDFNGLRCKARTDEDSEFYFIGRSSVSDFVAGAIHSLSITIDAEAYRYKKEITVVSLEGTGVKQELTLNNLQKKVAPTWTATAETKIKFGDNVFNIGIGKHKLDLMLEPGANLFEVTTEGTLTAEYQERGL